MHALHGPSAVSMNTVHILVMAAQESSSAIITHRVILMLSEHLSIDLPVRQRTAFETIQAWCICLC